MQELRQMGVQHLISVRLVQNTNDNCESCRSMKEPRKFLPIEVTATDIACHFYLQLRGISLTWSELSINFVQFRCTPF